MTLDSTTQLQSLSASPPDRGGVNERRHVKEQLYKSIIYIYRGKDH